MRIVRRSYEDDGGGFAGDVHPVLARVYRARAVRNIDEVDHGLAHLHHFDALCGIGRAVDVLEAALRAQQRILVIGDYDADGATACALALRGLRLLGFDTVHYLVPNRFEFGYGLTPEIVQVAAEMDPDVLITVDNGISSIAGAEAAAARGMRLIITDHHLPGASLPRAAAIVNPNLPGDAFPSKALAGVGVMFYLLIALRARLRQTGAVAGDAARLGRLLDLVALGTVADVVPLDRNNRILVAQGLQRIRTGAACPGIDALLAVASRDPAMVSASDLAFFAAPRLNAAGRLEDISLGIECLLCDDPARARRMASELDRLNRERRVIESGMAEEAVMHLENLQFGPGRDVPFGVVLYDEGWHPGVVGIVASRIKERVHRPVIAFAPEDGAGLKGSARSVDGVHIRDAIEAVAARHPGLVTRFGGHAMAAGLSIDRAALPRFRQAFDDEARRLLGGAPPDGVIYSDGPLNGDEIGLDLARLLRDAGPWGQGFPEPVFDGEFDVIERRIVGEKHLKLCLGLPASPQRVEAIAFNTVDRYWPDGVRRVRIAYRLDVNRFRGVDSAQLVVEHLEPLTDP